MVEQHITSVIDNDRLVNKMTEQRFTIAVPEETIADFPSRTAVTSADFCEALSETLSRVTNSIAEFDETRW